MCCFSERNTTRNLLLLGRMLFFSRLLTSNSLNDGEGHDKTGGEDVADSQWYEEAVEHAAHLRLAVDGQADKHVATDGCQHDAEECQHGPLVALLPLNSLSLLLSFPHLVRCRKGARPHQIGDGAQSRRRVDVRRGLCSGCCRSHAPRRSSHQTLTELGWRRRHREVHSIRRRCSFSRLMALATLRGSLPAFLL